MTYIITAPCKGVKDAACVAVCPCDCIHTTPEEDMYFIDPDSCVECGACLHVCPVQAIYYAGDEPDEYKEYEEINAAFFRKT